MHLVWVDEDVPEGGRKNTYPRKYAGAWINDSAILKFILHELGKKGRSRKRLTPEPCSYAGQTCGSGYLDIITLGYGFFLPEQGGKNIRITLFTGRNLRKTLIFLYSFKEKG